MPSQVSHTRTLSGGPGITSQVHDEEVNFQFRPCLKRPGACSFPNTSLVLDTRRHRLMLGQPYRLSLSLELPESPENQVRVRGELTQSEMDRLLLIIPSLLSPCQYLLDNSIHIRSSSSFQKYYQDNRINNRISFEEHIFQTKKKQSV